MDIELKPELESRLQVIADAQGVTVAQLAARILTEHALNLLKSQEEKEKAVEAMREFMRTNTATLDRASMGNPTLRELMHEGHKY